MRSVQSAYMAMTRCLPNRLVFRYILPAPSMPDCRRRSHAASDESNVPRFLGISRVALLPMEWHGVQVLVFTWLIHMAWLRIASEIPLPFWPVPGNSLLAGMLSIAYQ
jgi:hypothetical protein